MPRRIAVSNLNGTTVEILNTIRANASAEYQSAIPEITKANDIPKVGEILYGTPALANQFISTLVNRIAAVRVKSATFNNRFAPLKKGYLEFGETVEEVFINVCKAIEFSAEKAYKREHKRYMPDVKSAFHAINWRVIYPITVQDEDLRMAFTSASGVIDLIAKIVQSVYTAAEYDEYLLFKYLLIKAVAHGKMYPVAVDMSDIKNSAVAFRGKSNKLEFMSKEYNASGVTTTTPKADQYIFMDADFNAQYDVGVLASAFNMDKAEFMGKLQLVDDFTSFDNERFAAIRAESDGLEEVTAAELSLMADVKAVLVDQEWFQVYDNVNKMTEQYTASGLYWNYFYHVWKTVSSSPFSNAIVFVDDGASIDAPATLTVKVLNKVDNGTSTIVTVAVNDATGLAYNEAVFAQGSDVSGAIAVHPYGAIIFDNTANKSYVPELTVGNTKYKGASTVKINKSSAINATFTVDKQS